MKEKNLISQPQSIFYKVKCNKCGNEQIIFNSTSTQVSCKVCDETLATPLGGKASIKGEIIEELS
jgi:small subunit ribosomal protein S27e